MRWIPDELRIPLADWPMSHLVMLTGIVLSLWTGARVVTSTWDPPESWLLFLGGMLTVTFATKRMTWKPESPQNTPPPDVPPGAVGTDPPSEKLRDV